MPLWYGAYTRNWWALVDGRLVETRTPDELRHVLDQARTSPPRG